MAFHHSSHLSQDLPLHHFTEKQQQQQTVTAAPNWLNTALLRPQQSEPPQPHGQFSNPNFLNLHTTTTASDSTMASQAPNPMLSRSSSALLNRNHRDVIEDAAEAAVAASVGGGVSMMAVESDDLKNSISETMNNNNNNNKSEGVMAESGGGGGGDGVVNWQNARYKAEILAHPFYEQLLSAHVACLRIATPVDQLPRIDTQLAQSRHVVAKYSTLVGGSQVSVSDNKELDQFLVFHHYSKPFPLH